MLRLWLRIGPAVCIASMLLTGFERFYWHASPSAGIHALGADGALSLAIAAAPTIPVWIACRRGASLRALSPQLKRWLYMGLAALLLPAVVMLPLPTGFYLGCLPPYALEVANRWALPCTLCLTAYWVVVMPLVTICLVRGIARPDPDAPRCHHCGYSLKGAPGPRCPECGSACEGACN